MAHWTRGRYQLALIAAMSLAGCATVPQGDRTQRSSSLPSAAACTETVRVGSWNIEWLGKPSSRKSKVEQTPEDVAAYLRNSAVDVVALVEVSAHGTVGGERRNRILDKAMQLLSTGGADWQYRLFPKRPGSRDASDQWTGIAWNAKRLTLKGSPAPLQIEIDPVKEAALCNAMQRCDQPPIVVLSRIPYAVTLSAGPGKTDFVVVPLHLKSNYGGEKPTSEIRKYEMELVLKAAAAMTAKTGEKDFVFVGDVNTLQGAEPANALAIASGYRDCNAGNASTYMGRPRPAPFDRIFVATAQPETAGSCAPAAPAPLAFRVAAADVWKPAATIQDFERDLSDHLLVSAGICIGADDD